jgi:hypothetical protein
MSRTIRFAFAWLGIVAATAGGCGGSTSVPVFPTTGRILFQGKPLEGVQVTFRPVAPAGGGEVMPVPLARTDAEGKFRLATAVGEGGLAVDGAPAGEYTVALTASGRSDSIDFLGKGATKAVANPIGDLYADPQTSGLKATVKPGPNELEPFDLKPGGGPALGIPSGQRGR